MSSTYYRPLTPKFRAEIMSEISNQIKELDTCQSNAFVNVQKISLQSLQTIINGLPDGYPIPMKKVGGRNE